MAISVYKFAKYLKVGLIFTVFTIHLFQTSYAQERSEESSNSKNYVAKVEFGANFLNLFFDFKMNKDVILGEKPPSIKSSTGLPFGKGKFCPEYITIRRAIVSIIDELNHTYVTKTGDEIPICGLHQGHLDEGEDQSNYRKSEDFKHFHPSDSETGEILPHYHIEFLGNNELTFDALNFILSKLLAFDGQRPMISKAQVTEVREKFCLINNVKLVDLKTLPKWAVGGEGIHISAARKRDDFHALYTALQLHSSLNSIFPWMPENGYDFRPFEAKHCFGN